MNFKYLRHNEKRSNHFFLHFQVVANGIAVALDTWLQSSWIEYQSFKH